MRVTIIVCLFNIEETTSISWVSGTIWVWNPWLTWLVPFRSFGSRWAFSIHSRLLQVSRAIFFRLQAYLISSISESWWGGGASSAKQFYFTKKCVQTLYSLERAFTSVAPSQFAYRFDILRLYFCQTCRFWFSIVMLQMGDISYFWLHPETIEWRLHLRNRVDLITERETLFASPHQQSISKMSLLLLPFDSFA